MNFSALETLESKTEQPQSQSVPTGDLGSVGECGTVVILGYPESQDICRAAIGQLWRG